MPRTYVDLRRSEQEALDELVGDNKPQPLFRALIKMLTEDETLREEALEQARKHDRLDPHPDEAPGFNKGLGEEDYRTAIEEEGSLTGAAERLGVDRSTAREMAELYEIYVPSMDKVPG